MRIARGIGLLLVLSLAVAGCAGLLESAPTAEPVPFPEITGQLGRFGITVSNWASGDPGCNDQSLSPTAIRFEAQGLDQSTSILLRIYIFGNREAWDRRLADVDTCAAAWATDPATFEQLQISPYVVAGQGPWPPAFAAALRSAITASAGNGG